MPYAPILPPGLCAQLAFTWATTARCPGNCHRFADFPDAPYIDFLTSAAAVGPMLEAAPRRRVGETILDCIRATRRVVAANTNLGVVLLLAPLASVPPDQELRAGVAEILDRLDVADACDVFAAIRLAAPAGLGRVPDQDVADEPTQPLRSVMALAADRDLVARQYVNGFREVFDHGLPALLQGLYQAHALEEAIVFCHLHLLATHPDSLIARKCGLADATTASQRAAAVLDRGWPDGADGWRALAELDGWLRAADRGRNPGTTADLVTASLFAAFRGGSITLPSAFPWSAGWDHGRVL